jgi:hypothetical protein
MTTERELRLARALVRLSGADLLRFVRTVQPNATCESRWCYANRLLEYAEQTIADADAVPRET